MLRLSKYLAVLGLVLITLAILTPLPAVADTALVSSGSITTDTFASATYTGSSDYSYAAGSFAGGQSFGYTQNYDWGWGWDWNWGGNDDHNCSKVPEPGTMMLLGGGLVPLVRRYLRRK